MTSKRRMTVTFDENVYDELKKMVDSHQPSLSINYVVNRAVLEFVDRAKRANASPKLTDLDDND